MAYVVQLWPILGLVIFAVVITATTQGLDVLDVCSTIRCKIATVPYKLKWVHMSMQG